MPEGYTSASFAELVLEQANVVVSPGDAYGPSGEGYVRLSLTVPDDRLQEAVSPHRARRWSYIQSVSQRQPDPAQAMEPERGFIVAVLGS